MANEGHGTYIVLDRWTGMVSKLGLFVGFWADCRCDYDSARLGEFWAHQLAGGQSDNRAVQHTGDWPVLTKWMMMESRGRLSLFLRGG